MAESASKHLGQPVVIDNKPGGSATLGPAAVAAAKPDGYTVAQIAITVFRVPYMQKTTYDPLKDFTYIIHLGGYTLGAVVLGGRPVQDLEGRHRLRQGQPRQVHLRDDRPGDDQLPSPWS